MRATLPPSWSIRIGTSGSSGDVAEIVRHPPHLVAAFAVAAEKDEAGRVGVAEEVALFRRDLRPGQSVNRCLHQFATKQFSPATFSAWQA